MNVAAATLKYYFDANAHLDQCYRQPPTQSGGTTFIANPRETIVHWVGRIGAVSAAAVDEGLLFLHALPERPVGVSVPVIVSLASSVFLSYGFFFQG